MYSPDFVVRTAGAIYLVETKGERDLSNENVNRKRKAALAWCGRINSLPEEARGARVWRYALLGQQIVEQFRSGNMRVTDLLEHSKLTSESRIGVQERLL